ncbi:MAG TPA: ureidoglycolate lyase [Planktothrix sp.]
MKSALINAVPLTRDEYAPYGNLIAADEALPFIPANMATAKRFNWMADVINLRPDSAKLNLCLFRCTPLAKLPLELKLLEKHPHSTQVFMPTSNDARFLVIVCLGGDRPDLSTLKVFEARNGQSISYKPGVWHYPMTALERPIDFTCLIWEDGSPEDCIVQNLEEPLTISV